MPLAQEWNSNSPAIAAHPTAGRATSLRHATYPFVVSGLASLGADHDQLFIVAAGYLNAVKDRFELPPDLVDDSTGDFREQNSLTQLTWLPIRARLITAQQARLSNRRHSFWVRRYYTAKGGGQTPDVNVVLLAMESLRPNSESTVMASRLGIRINARVMEYKDEDTGEMKWKVGVTSSSCSPQLAQALDTPGPGQVTANAAFEFFMEPEQFATKAKQTIATAAGVPADRLTIEGFRIMRAAGPHAEITIHANLGRSQARGDFVAYALTARAAVDLQAKRVTVTSLAKTPLVANAVQYDLLLQDPPSKEGDVVKGRANRSRRILDNYRTAFALQGVLEDANSKTQLCDQEFPQGDVKQSRLVNRQANESQSDSIDRNHVTSARTNSFAALSAYKNIRDLFNRMRSYGISPNEYFKFAKLPLHVRYRAAIIPGPGKDGRTVNAQVDYDPPSDEFGKAVVDGQDERKPLQVRFALGDLRRSWSRRELLGIAADPRWCWHEFGHVLLAASTGGLELPFAHSVGDALAAIVADPKSQLALHGRLRGATYPWVQVGRRHDREVSLGWGWCGNFHRPNRLPAYSSNRQRKGYHSEQILSSSLFRLYRSLGGETFNGANAAKIREDASQYAVYLIMRAVQMLPHASAGSANDPEDFVDLLIEADTTTAPRPNPNDPLYGRVGGWAHKVVRWAFEAQGLYGNVPDDQVNNTPGDPPPVDVFIDDRRLSSEGRHPRGGYMPVSLRWDAPAAEPSWLADEQWMKITPNNRLQVWVENRGSRKADSVSVRAWKIAWPQTNPPSWDNPPPWDATQWTELDNSPDGPKDIAPGQAKRFGAFRNLPTAAGRYLILASASCETDRANIDGDAELPLPTSQHPVPIVDLVAGDNNLGLLVVTI